MGGHSTAGVADASIVGAVVSATVTWNRPATVFPYGSVAEQSTFAVPIAKIDPDAGAHVACTVSTSFDATAANVTRAPDALVASATMSAGSARASGSIFSVSGGAAALVEPPKRSAPL